MINEVNFYDVESHIPEIYDQEETQTRDLKSIMKLLQNTNCGTILEPFCGTGRILLPLAEESYEIVGIDSSVGMLRRLREKLPPGLRANRPASDPAWFPLPSTLLPWESGTTFQPVSTHSTLPGSLFRHIRTERLGGTWRGGASLQ